MNAPAAPAARLVRCGPYVLDEPLASGAFGVVYRARHGTTGEAVAVKTLRAGASFELESLRREARALSQLDHPGVVRILDHGIEGGFPWVAMELLDGGTLADVLAAAGDADARRRRALSLLHRVCGALAFLHGEGIVHRDLKPENIAIRRAGDTPVLLDFGVIGRWSAKLAREALETGGELIGTLSYMAPEQARGEYVDARADLYALGCLLYQAVVGRPPFVGSAARVLRDQLETAPQRPSERAPGVDPRLDALILRLLEKDPARRLGFAEDVAAALDAVLGTASPAPPARPYLYRPSFVGRARIRDALLAAVDALAAGRGGCVMLSGESGSGKTRLAMEITRAAVAAGVQVITGECAAAESAEAAAQVSAAPLLPVRPLLRAAADRCIREGATTTAALLGRRAKVLAAYEPVLQAVPAYEAQPEPTPLPPAAERDRALGDVAELAATIAATAPLLLVLDDLQWADDMTLALLETHGESIVARAPVLLLGAYRREEVSPALAAVLGARHVATLDLDRLDREDVGAMVASMLAMDPPPRQLVRMLRGESEGNPFFVAEYLRAAVEAGFLYRSAGAWEVGAAHRTDDPLHGALPLPHSLGELLARRYAALREPALSLLAAGAVLGRRFELELAGEVLGAEDEQLLDAMRELVRRQVLEEADAGAVRFTHDKLREAAYARIPPAHAAQLHARAAQALEARYAGGPGFPARYAELAHHWEIAEVPSRAVHYFGLAGEHALATGAHKDAHLMIGRALDLDDAMDGAAGPLRRAQWRRMLGISSFGLGDLDGSIRHSAAALTGLDERVPRSTGGWIAVAALELGRALISSRRSAAHRRDQRMYEAAQACGQLATSYFYNADVVPAAATLLRGLNRAARAGDDGTVVESCARLGYVSGAIGLDVVARRMFRRAHDTAARAADARGHALALYLDGMYQEFLGRWDACRRLAEEATGILDTIGDMAEAETARAIASHGYFFAGQFHDARACGAAILRTADERANKQHIGWGQYLIARCDVVLGALESAIARLDDARVLLEPLPDAIDIVICEGWLARAHLYRDDLDAAAAVADRLGERLSSGKRPAVGQCVDAYAGWADIALARWHRDPRSAAASAAALRACAELRRFARIFRMARPAAARCTATAEWVRGRHHRAMRAWQRGVEHARTLGMPYDEARALADLGAVLENAADRERYGAEARQLFEQLGCPIVCSVP